MSEGEQLPKWFSAAVNSPGRSAVVDVAGCPIHYLSWGEPAWPALVFVPPSGGHAHWFSHVAPLFADQFRVIAMDPSGCGDSGRREAYSADLLTAEIMGVCDDSKTVRPVLVGHSAGAQAVVRAALKHGSDLLGIIAIDGLRYAELEKDHAVKVLKGPRPHSDRKPSRVHASLAESTARFRLTPAPLVPVENTFVVEHIARHSFRQVEDGWVSKYDPAQGAIITLALELSSQLKDLDCRAAALYAEHSHLAEADAAQRMGALNDFRVPVFIIPATHHYPQIDQPFAFVAAIKGLTTAWLAESTA